MKLLFLGNVKKKINFYIILFLASVLTSCGGGGGGSIPSKDNVDPSVTLTIPENNEETDLLTAIWVSKTSIISRRYTPKLGWFSTCIMERI